MRETNTAATVKKMGKGAWSVVVGPRVVRDGFYSRQDANEAAAAINSKSAYTPTKKAVPGMKVVIS